MWNDKATCEGGPPQRSEFHGVWCWTFCPAMSISRQEQALERLRAEYLEMPGMRLKLEQVQRLCGIERSICQGALDLLVKANFLCVKSDGRYARLADGSR